MVPRNLIFPWVRFYKAPRLRLGGFVVDGETYRVTLTSMANTGEPSKICIAAITRGDPRVEFVGSVMQLMSHPRVSHISLHPTLYLHHGRTECVNEFLSHPEYGDWLLFIDDDTQFTIQAFETLVAAMDARIADIVGGIYWSPNFNTDDPSNDVWPVVMTFAPGDKDDKVYMDSWLHKSMPRAWVARQTEPFECDAIGTGFMATHRDTYMRMREIYPGPLHWFGMDTIEGVSAGEDLTFCWRAKEIGLTIKAVPFPSRDDIIHIKLCKIRRPRLPGQPE